ncbi:MAG TPA: acyl-CoA dehydrogenase family protein [Polyangiales bacterium]
MSGAAFDAAGPLRQELLERMRALSSESVAPHAGAVDREARFPHEAVAALRKARMLGCAVPEALGGMGANLPELSALTSILAEHCASTAMIFAMHQIQVLCLVRHHAEQPALRDYLAECSERQLLIASATSEIGVGGDTRTSLCAVERKGERFALKKQASVISYGEYTDDVLVTARRAADAAGSDQVLVLVRKQDGSLVRNGSWDTLGMRGTCSVGFELSAEGPVGQILPVPFAEISAQTMHPVSHILWTSVWTGIANSAVSIARKYLRAEARKKPGTTPPSAMRVAELVNQLHGVRAFVRDAIDEYGRHYDDPDGLSTLGFQIRMNNLKIGVSEQVVPIVAKALAVCGISGYRNDSPYALGQKLRDAYGAGVMILNDRLYGTNATLLLVSKED